MNTRFDAEEMPFGRRTVQLRSLWSTRPGKSSNRRPVQVVCLGGEAVRVNHPHNSNSNLRFGPRFGPFPRD